MLTDPASVVADSSAVTQALGDSVTAAGCSPSIHGARPWRWRLDGEVLDLFVDQDEVPDGEDQLSIMNCGAALHHGLISLAANGWQPAVLRLPNAAFPEHLATIRIDHRSSLGPPTDGYQTPAATKDAGRIRIGGGPGYADALRSIVVAAESAGTSLCLLRAEQVFDLITATTVSRDAVASVQHATFPTDVFEPDGEAAVFAILHGPEDRACDWLRAGEALAAAWLTASRLGISVLPLSDTITRPDARTNVRRLLPGPGHPYLILRFGPALRLLAR